MHSRDVMPAMRNLCRGAWGLSSFTGGFDEVGVNWLQWIKIQYANKPCLHMEWSGIPIWNQPNINVFVTAARILPTGTRCQQQVGIYKYQKRDEGLHCGGPPLLCLLQGPPTVHVTHKRRRKIGLALLPLPQYARHSIIIALKSL